MYTQKTRCLLPLSGIFGGGIGQDYSQFKRPELIRGSPSIDAAKAKGYGASGHFGAGDSLELDAPDLDMTGEWSVDGWVYMPAASAAGDYNGLVSFMTYGSNNDRLQIYVASGTFRAWSDSTSHLLSYNDIPFSAYTDKWTHFALQRKADTSLEVFFDGALVWTEASSQAPSYSRKIHLNYLRASSSHKHSDSEWLQDIRVTTGATIWPSGGFTPPVRLVGKLAGTVEDAGGYPANRTVRSYSRSSGHLFSEAQSVGGSFVVPAYAGDLATCIATSNVGENALIFDRLEPVAP